MRVSAILIDPTVLVATGIVISCVVIWACKRASRDNDDT